MFTMSHGCREFVFEFPEDELRVVTIIEFKEILDPK